MPKTAAPNPSSNTRLPRSTRSVAGCLTCRRRRVKCTSRGTPCEPCRRLNLSCNSSFHQNFKSWKAESPQAEAGSIPNTRGRSNRAVFSRHVGTSESSTATVRALDVSTENGAPRAENLVIEGCSGNTRANVADETTHPNAADQDEPFSLLDFIFADLSNEITPVDFGTPTNTDLLFNADWAMQRAPFSSTGDDENNSGDAPAYSAATSAAVVTASHHGQGDTARPLTDPAGSLDLTTSQTIYRVPELMSTKQSIYTCFHYLINSARSVPDSPLCHALLGWVYAYLARVNTEMAGHREQHYIAASDAIRSLSAELCTPSQLSWRVTNSSDQLSLYVSSIFFLCQHDLMLGHFDSFLDRIRDTKTVFQRQWAERTLPGPVESRIVIWLAFVELRFYLMGGQTSRVIEDEKDLITILQECKALPALRQARTQKSLLSHMFPDGLPQEENEEDLQKDYCRVKFDELMYYLSKVRRFTLWDQAQGRKGLDAEILQELRSAKIEALQADLRRLHAECELDVPLSKELPNGEKPINSITFHRLTVATLRCCATILFKRATRSVPGSDADCQAAVAEILRIARRFRQLKYLRSPRSTIWPLPLFIAGIETTDGVYQDWIVDYMDELGSWGAHIQMSAEILQQVAKQDAQA